MVKSPRNFFFSSVNSCPFTLSFNPNHYNHYYCHFIIGFSKMDVNQLTPEQRQAVLMQAQQEANQRIMSDMIQRMVKTCFNKCAGTSVG